MIVITQLLTLLTLEKDEKIVLIYFSVGYCMQRIVCGRTKSINTKNKLNMKTSILKITAILLIVAGGFSACNEPEDVLTGQFYVILSSNPERCGHFLSWMPPSYAVWSGVWAENLPEEFQVRFLPVIVTYRVIAENGNDDCDRPIINIIRIRKQ